MKWKPFLRSLAAELLPQWFVRRKMSTRTTTRPSAADPARGREGRGAASGDRPENADTQTKEGQGISAEQPVRRQRQ